MGEPSPPLRHQKRSGAKSPARDPVQARRAAAEKRAETAPLRKRISQAEVAIVQFTRQLQKLETERPNKRVAQEVAPER